MKAPGSFTSVSVTLFSDVNKEVKMRRLEYLPGYCLFALVLLCSLCMVSVSAEVLDRIVAVVNNEIILLSDLERETAATAELAEEDGTTREDILERMINRRILFDEAVKFRLKNVASDEQAVVDLYIERRIRSLIHISLKESEAYYLDNSETYGETDFYEVKDEIESILEEKELEARLKKHIEELRRTTYIRIQLDESEEGD